jgi:hypothetical protein
MRAADDELERAMLGAAVAPLGRDLRTAVQRSIVVATPDVRIGLGPLDDVTKRV